MYVPEQFEHLVLQAEEKGAKDTDTVEIRIKSVRDKGGGFLRVTFLEFKDFVTYGRSH